MKIGRHYLTLQDYSSNTCVVLALTVILMLVFGSVTSTVQTLLELFWF